MKKYAFDTSGISNPLESMPEDIHESMWKNFKEKILPSGIIAGIAPARAALRGAMEGEDIGV